jgi:hypothetical protein
MLRLTPESSEDTQRLSGSYTEITREPTEVLDIAEPFAIPDKAITVLRVRTGHFTINASINTLRKADRLVVTFMGSRGGGRDSVASLRPMFARRQWDALYQAPILALSDPQTEVDWDTTVPREGLYMGTFEHDLVPEVLALVNKVCDELGIDRDRVVMVGALSGGTSALLVGSRRREATGVVVTCPYLRPDKYRDQMVASVTRAMGGTADDWQRTSEEQPWRNYPLTAMRDGINDGNNLRVVVAQNVRDSVTINRHFPGFWRRFDIDPEGGVASNGRIMAVLYDAPGAGHGQEPPEFSRPLVELAYGFFDKPVEATPRKKKEKKFTRADADADAGATSEETGDAAPALQAGKQADAPRPGKANGQAKAKAKAKDKDKDKGNGQGKGNAQSKKAQAQGKAEGRKAQAEGKKARTEGQEAQPQDAKAPSQDKSTPAQGKPLGAWKAKMLGLSTAPGQGNGQGRPKASGERKAQGEAGAQGQRQTKGDAKPQGQEKPLGKWKAKMLGLSTAPGQGQSQGQAQGQRKAQGDAHAEGQGKAQGAGKAQGQRKAQGNPGPGKAPGQGAGKANGHGQPKKPGKGPGKSKGQGRGAAHSGEGEAAGA